MTTLRVDDLMIKDEIGSGVSGKIFSTNDKRYVIKKGKFEALLPEIDFLSQVEGDAVVKMYGFKLETQPNYYRDDKFYLRTSIILDYGIPIKNYGGSMTQNRLIGSIVNAVAACRDIGLVHGDIKTDNIVVVNERPVLIDFGLSLWDMVGRYFGLAYTGTYRDPNFIIGTWNSVANETFALGKTVAVMSSYYRCVPSNLPPITSNLVVNDLLQQTLELNLENRPSLATLRQRFTEPLYAHSYTMIRKPSRPIPSKSHTCGLNAETWPILMDWVHHTAINKKIGMRTLFTLLTNIHRSSAIYDGIGSEQVQNTLETFGAAHLLLADYCLSGERSLAMKDIFLNTAGRSLRSSNPTSGLAEMISDIVTLLHGTLSGQTVWDRLVEQNSGVLTVAMVATALEDVCRLDYRYRQEERSDRDKRSDRSGSDRQEKHGDREKRQEERSDRSGNDRQEKHNGNHDLTIVPLDCRYRSFQRYLTKTTAKRNKDYTKILVTHFNRPSPEEVLEYYERYCKQHPVVIDSFDELGLVWGSRSVLHLRPAMANEIFGRLLDFKIKWGRNILLDAFDVVWGDKLKILQRTEDRINADRIRTLEDNSWILTANEIIDRVANHTNVTYKM
jgi:hypothetical protein